MHIFNSSEIIFWWYEEWMIRLHLIVWYELLNYIKKQPTQVFFIYFAWIDLFSGLYLCLLAMFQ